MTLATIVSLISGMIVIVGAWFALIVFIPADRRSRFRYELWDLHDQIVDDVLDGRMPRDAGVAEVLRTVHIAIENARHASFLKFALMPKDGLDERLRTYLEARSTRFATYTKEQRDRFRSYEERFAKATLVYLLTGSPSGWASMTFRVPYFSVKAVFTSEPRVREAVRSELLDEKAKRAAVREYWSLRDDRFTRRASAVAC